MPTITIRNADRLQHVAVSRLQLYVSGQVHALLYPFQAWLVREVAGSGDAGGFAQASDLAGVVNAAAPRWKAVMADYAILLQQARRVAGSFAFTPYRLRHNRYIAQPLEQLQEAYTPTPDDWRQLAQMWLRRRDYALQVAQQRVYSDGLNLSQRIWRLEQGGMQAIRNTIASGMAERTNAWDLAERLERQLNANQEWPQWAESRLRSMDARQRAQSTEGLWRTAADARKANADAELFGLTPQAGISYNALRLARNEIQAANHAVTSDIAIHSPWVTGRKVVLSPAHPKSDICDELAAGGPYDKTANFLPAHVQCLCSWREVLMPPADFARQTRGWVAGENDFLDDYGSWLGTRSFAPWPETLGMADALELVATMQAWLGNDVDAAAAVLKLQGG
jgi:hypothetical protein